MDGIKLTEEHIVFQVDAVAQVLMKLSDPDQFMAEEVKRWAAAIKATQFKLG